MESNLNIKKLFVDFLVKNNIYHSFVNNYNAYNYNASFINFIYYFEEKKALNIPIAAFNWYHTKEGYDFWFKVYKQWEDVLFKYSIRNFIFLLKKYGLYGSAIKIIQGDKLKIQLLKASTLDLYPQSLFKKTTIPKQSRYYIQYNMMVKEWEYYINRKNSVREIESKLREVWYDYETSNYKKNYIIN